MFVKCISLHSKSLQSEGMGDAKCNEFSFLPQCTFQIEIQLDLDASYQHKNHPSKVEKEVDGETQNEQSLGWGQ